MEASFVMQKLRYPEPDGYVKMRFRDIIAAAIVVACFALAAIVSHLWRTVVHRSGLRWRTKQIKLAENDN